MTSSAWLHCLVAGATVGCCALIAPLAYHLSGEIGLLAIAAAAIPCYLGAIGAIWAAYCLRGPDRLLPRVLGGMLIRMGVPLGAALLVQVRGGALADAGFVYYVLVFYLVALAVETGLWVRHG